MSRYKTLREKQKAEKITDDEIKAEVDDIAKKSAQL